MDCFPALSSDGRRLYFDSNRAVSKDMPPEHRNTWFVEKVASGWSDPRPMGAPVNSGNENTQATVDSNGNLYFGSSREGGRGSFDIYVSRLVKGRYVEPENLGDTVNTSGLEYSPYVDPAGRYLLFCAGERPDSRGGMDLFVSFRDRDGSWMQAVNLGDRINTPDDEYWPAVSPDGRHLFFVSARTGNFDVYWVDASVIDAARPKNSR